MQEFFPSPLAKNASVGATVSTSLLSFLSPQNNNPSFWLRDSVNGLTSCYGDSREGNLPPVGDAKISTVSALPSSTHIISIAPFPGALSVLGITKKKYYQTAVTSSKVNFGALEMMPKESQTTAAFCSEETTWEEDLC